MLGTKEILASKHDIAALKVKQGHFKNAIFSKLSRNETPFYDPVPKQ